MNATGNSTGNILENAIRLHRAGDLDAAEKIYQALVETGNPDTWRDVRYLLANLYLQRQEYDRSLQFLTELLSRHPDHLHALNLLALVSQHMGRADKALRYYQLVIKQDEGNLEALYNLGYIYQQQKKYLVAEDFYRRVLERQGDHLDACYHLALVLQKSARLAESEQYYRQCLDINPEHVYALNNLGEVLQDQGKLEDAETMYRQAIALQPGLEGVHNNLGTLLHEQGRYNEAVASYQEAIGINPEYADAHLNLSLTCLLLGNYREGWSEYEWRWGLDHVTRPVYGMPAWKGEPLADKKVLVYAEQGLGDTFHFIRYLPLLKQQGAYIIFVTLPGLKKISRWCSAIDELYVLGEADISNRQDIDYQCALMSIPGILGTELSTIPADIPYLDSRDAFELPRQLATDDFKVGIVWGGRPKFGSDPHRNPACPLAEFESLLSVDGTRFFSLQKGDAASQIETCGFSASIEDLEPLLGDFVDTAHIIRSLDLVITIDTSVAHLCGALGKNVWLLLPTAPDWRWLLGREDTPWYPTMMIFRQQEPGGWSPLMERVRDVLQTYMAARSVRPNEIPTYLQQAAACMQAARYEEAIALYAKCLALAPDHFDALNNQAIAFKNTGRYSEAIRNLETAAGIRPDNAAVHNNLGNVYKQLGEYTKARESFAAGLLLKPDDAEILNNLGNTCQAMGSVQEALAYLKKSISRKPDFAQAHFNYGIACLLAGDYTHGWQEYEWGILNGQRYIPECGLPRWEGSKLEGQRLLVLPEQGVGDTLQFLRFLPMLQARGAHVILSCQPGLKRLLDGYFGVDELVEQGQDVQADMYVPLLSLPYRLGITLENVPAEIPYLYPEPCSLGQWQARFHGQDGYKVGIVWSGNPRHDNDRNRSCDPQVFETLFGIEGIRFYSLQKGQPTGQVKSWQDRYGIEDLGPDLLDYADTAAAICCLDLLITVDTSVAHLAGALGQTVWTLLPFAPDWRWLLGRNDSPWYPGMRLFRQAQPGGWQDLMSEVRGELESRPLPVMPNTNEEEPPAEDADSLVETGNRIAMNGNLAEARHYYEQALALEPEYPEALNNLANILRAEGELTRAKQYYQQALALKPNYEQAYNGLAVTLQELGEWTAALDYFRKAVEINPDFSLGHYNASLLYLLLGQYRQGFEEYEWRLSLANHQLDDHKLPVWASEEPANRRILVIAEQGAGDTLQFIRFLPMLQQRGAYVILECPPGLKRLLAGFRGVDEVVARGQEVTADCYVPLMSLPHRLGVTLENLPADIPYLYPEPEQLGVWQERMYARDGFKVGIVWSGNPLHENDRNRSCLLQDLEPLLGMEGVTYFSLQKGERASQLPPLQERYRIESLDSDLQDYADTAAAICCLDLLITVDTSVAHLAGALGRPVWLMLPHAPDWRWLLERDDSPWYPGMRLFRQPSSGNWRAISAQVRDELGNFIRRQGKETGRGKQTGMVNSESVQNLKKKGLQAHQQGRLDEAKISYEQVLEKSPNDQETGFLLANLYFQQQDLSAARDQLSRLLESSGTNPAVVNLMGLVSQELADLTAAESAFVRAIELAPDYYDARANYGYLLQNAGRYAEAETVYEQMADEGMASADTYYNLGVVYQSQKKFPQAREAYEQSLELRPDNARAQNNLGLVWQQLQDNQAAIKCFRLSLQETPDSAEVLNNLGCALQAEGELAQAQEVYQQALQQNPQFVDAMLNLGSVFQRMDNALAAEEQFSRVLEIDPHNAVACNNLATVMLRSGKYDAALDYYHAAIRNDPSYVDAHFNLGIACLLTGDYHRGWKEYDWRLKREISGVRDVTGQRWDGSELQGKNILVFVEQGYGDTFQFVRFLPLIKQRGGTVILECQNGLRSVLKACDGVDRILDWSEDGNLQVEYDVSIPLMSIPAVLDLGLEDIRVPVPYIHLNSETPPELKQQFTTDTCKVGIVWAGRPTHQNDRNRSCQLADFNPLFSSGSKAAFFSLQKGEAVRQLETNEFASSITNLDTHLHSFADTAAAIRELDLVISVDTSVAHLAGAMGKETWVLLPKVPDWRWLLDRNDTPWYPTMRLFRQKNFRDWKTPMAEIVLALENRLHREAQ